MSDTPLLERRSDYAEIFARLRNMEADLSAIKAMLQEWRRQQEDQEARLREVEKAEHKRSGGLIVLGILMSLAGTAGAAVMKLLTG